MVNNIEVWHLAKDYELINYHYNNASIIKVPNAGHWLHADNPDFFLEKTINFLNL